LLADQSALPRIADIRQTLAHVKVLNVLDPSAQPPADGASPLLIDITDLDASAAARRVLSWLCEQGAYANALTVLRSAFRLPALQQALRIRTEAELPDRYAVLLRFFDTRVLPRLFEILADEQKAAFFGCAAEWHYVGREGALIKLATQTTSDRIEFRPPLYLGAEQQNALIDACLTDAVIDQLINRSHAAVLAATPPEQYRLVAPLVHAARGYGLREVTAAREFCMLALDQGADFCEREPWATRLREVRAGRLLPQDCFANAP
jgi:Domain of unknown function (DUF4123)